MTLQAGDTAPDFTLVTKTSEGPQLVTLSEQIGSANIVLLFVPMASIARGGLANIHGPMFRGTAVIARVALCCGLLAGGIAPAGRSTLG